jgi:hypothetical protein
MNKQTLGAIALLSLLIACNPTAKKNPDAEKPARVERFFSDDSFWNTPLPDQVEIDPRSEKLIGYLKKDHWHKNFGINTNEYTIPVYEVDSSVPFVPINPIENGQGFSQSKTFREMGIPIPPDFKPSPGGDMHATIIDRDRGLAWDMFYVRQDSTGAWASFTGMVVDLRGSGVFDHADFPVKDDESIHKYGPSRAAGVPSFAGLIMYDEAAKGEINHKLACAVRFVALKQYVYPAIWTDGNFEGGIPEGAIIQLNPDLDLSQFNLLPGDAAVAKALQKYGAVVSDFAAGNALYAEGLWVHPDKSWEGILTGWDDATGNNGIPSIPLDNYRVLKLENIQTGGDKIKEFFQTSIRGWEKN